MRAALTFVLLVTVAIARASAAQDRHVTEKYLISGDLEGGQKALAAILKDHPDNGQARFGLGTIQFVRAVEHLVQGFFKHGLQPDVSGMVPFARLPLPANPKPEPVAYDDVRTMFKEFIDDLAKAEATLAVVKDDAVRLPIRFGLVRLDFDGDGKATDEETLWKLYARLNGQVGRDKTSGKEAEGFPITFDRGDVAWLRGYCHLLMTFSEVFLAHDASRLFDHTAHLFFAKPKTPFPFLKNNPAGDQPDGVQWVVNTGLIGDLVAFVHLLHFPLKEPARMGSALKHLGTMVTLSRESWKLYLAETDDDHEWIPNPKQDTVMPGGKVTDEMVKGWLDFLDEADTILAGKKLVPFWRDADKKGVNLRRVFTEPRELDPIFWAQGTAAAPYLEAGAVTQPEVWNRLLRVFRGEFIGFALWFN